MPRRHRVTRLSRRASRLPNAKDRLRLVGRQDELATARKGDAPMRIRIADSGPALQRRAAIPAKRTRRQLTGIGRAGSAQSGELLTGGQPGALGLALRHGLGVREQRQHDEAIPDSRLQGPSPCPLAW